MGAGPQVTFTTDFFKPSPSEDEEMSPGRYGKELAQWLAAKLEERGVSVEEVIPEDFGWVVMVSRKPFMLWLGCGNTDGSTVQWTVFPVAEPSLVHRIFRRADSAHSVEQLRAQLVELVPSIPRVTNIFWD